MMTADDDVVVLVVDDDQEFRKYIREASRAQDREFLTASNGRVALRIIEEKKDKVIAVLLDWELQGDTTGVDLLREIRRMAGHRTVCYLISDIVSIEEESAALEAGAYRRFSKSESIERIILYTSKEFVLRLIRRHNTDELTGLLNFGIFSELAKSELAVAYSRPDKHPEVFSLLYLDVDHFKEVNDRHGHDKGDEALSLIAEAISKHVRGPSDHPCRKSGDEFVVWLPDADQERAEKIGKSIQEEVVATKLLNHQDKEVPLSISFGTATICRDAIGNVGEEFNALLQRADCNLRAAKEARPGGLTIRAER